MSKIPKFLKPIFRPLRKYYLPYIRKPIAKPELKKAIERYIDSDDVVIEVGANVGGATRLLSSRAKYVYSFESSPNSFSILKKNTKNLINIKLFNLAVGEKEGTINLQVPNNDKTAGALGFYKFDSQPYNGETLNVSTIRLDKICFESKPNVLISDCEGYEVEVLHGAPLDSFDKVLVEWHRIDDSYATKELVIEILKKSRFTIKEEDYIIGIKK